MNTQWLKSSILSLSTLILITVLTILQLLSISGGKHGSFSRGETLKIYAAIHEFLAKHHLQVASQ